MKKIYILYVLFSVFVLTGCEEKKQYFEESGSVFHTLYRIKYESLVLLTEKIDAELQAFNLSLNPFNPNSIIAKVNNNEPVEVDEWFTDVFNKSIEISSRTEGVFDATSAPLINLWGFGFSKAEQATSEKIDSILQFVGYQKIRLQGKEVIKEDPRIMLNFSAIAKGYACDVIAALLEREGVENYMVEIGGEFVIKGVNPNGDCWRLGINKPENDLSGTIHKVEEVLKPCKKCGVATSGDYRNYREKDGQKFGHTIDPRTGYPATQDILSATVVAADCMTADGYATAFMAMGLEKAIEIAARIPEIEYYFIYADENGIHQANYSKGMIPYMPNRQELAILEDN
ncbi:MAG: FAD:protein FMN transferase [Tannerellaceae bacterium]|nr:FAD:protein FMN transferase [Tannerellaceae bacterium]